ncbi:MAG: SURF1 family protein [Gemmatimonadetes bacterium]|nr:SURF1 family protein [Gemmatimonadota bacterium]
MTTPDNPEHARRTIAITPAGIGGTILLAVVVVVCIRLGFWQLSRLDERRDLNAGIAERLEQAPVGDVSMLADTVGLAYRVATARGRYDNDRHLILPGRSHQGVPGVHLIMPLRLTGRTDALLVNRGWIPAPDAATIDARDFALLDTVAVRGLILPFPGRAQSLAQREAVQRQESFRHVLYRIDERELRSQFPYPLLSVMLQELDGAGAARYPVSLDPPPLDEGPHLGYALQWFGFAVVGVIGWLALILHGRTRPAAAAALTALVAAAVLPAPARAQLRPVDPLEWRIFDDDIMLVGGAGAGVLWDQPAPLAGTRGTLLEIGTYSLTLRSARIAVQVGGTALWRLTENDTTAPPMEWVEPADGTRVEPGPAFASTAFRMSPDAWPADIVLRFGATIATTSDESGLERDRTDFFALLSARYRRGALALTAENGVGIHGTVRTDLPQSDVWTYAFGASWTFRRAVLAADFIGRQDGHPRVIRGNEDQREIRAGFDLGRERWVRVRYVRGMAPAASPAHGVLVSAGLLLAR